MMAKIMVETDDGELVEIWQPEEIAWIVNTDMPEDQHKQEYESFFDELIDAVARAEVIQARRPK
jgi:ribonucleotide reductase beta subunit family protein with ferritin-like domain